MSNYRALVPDDDSQPGNSFKAAPPPPPPRRSLGGGGGRAVPARWYSEDPRQNNRRVDYTQSDSDLLETAFLTNEPFVHLNIGGTHVVVNLQDMTQKNPATGGQRPVSRDAPFVSAGRTSGGQQQKHVAAPQLSDLSRYPQNVQRILKGQSGLQQLEKLCERGQQQQGPSSLHRNGGKQQQGGGGGGSNTATAASSQMSRSPKGVGLLYSPTSHGDGGGGGFQAALGQSVPWPFEDDDDTPALGGRGSTQGHNSQQTSGSQDINSGTESLDNLKLVADMGHDMTLQMMLDAQRYLDNTVKPHTATLMQRCQNIQEQSTRASAEAVGGGGSMAETPGRSTTEGGNAGMTPRQSTVKGNSLRELKLTQIQELATKLSELDTTKSKSEEIVLDDNGEVMELYFSKQKRIDFTNSIRETRFAVNRFLDAQQQVYTDYHEAAHCLLEDAKQSEVATKSLIDKARNNILSQEKAIFDDFVTGMQKFADDRRRVLTAKKHELRTISEYDDRAVSVSAEVEKLEGDLQQVDKDLDRATRVHDRMRGIVTLKPQPKRAAPIDVDNMIGDDEADAAPSGADKSNRFANLTVKPQADEGGGLRAKFGSFVNRVLNPAGTDHAAHQHELDGGGQVQNASYTTRGEAPASNKQQQAAPSPAQKPVVVPPLKLGAGAAAGAASPQTHGRAPTPKPSPGGSTRGGHGLAPSQNENPQGVPTAQRQGSNAPPPSPAVAGAGGATRHVPKQGGRASSQGGTKPLQEKDEFGYDIQGHTSTAEVFPQRALGPDDMGEDDGAEEQGRSSWGVLGGLFGGRKVGTKDKREDKKQSGAKKASAIAPLMGKAQNDEEPEEDDGRAAKRPRRE